MFVNKYGLKVILLRVLLLNGEMVTYFILTDDLPKVEIGQRISN